VRRHGSQHLGVDVARADRVDGNPRPRTFEGESTGEAELGGFRRGIIRLPDLALLSVDGRNVDDPPELASPHALDERPAHIEQRIEIGADHRVPLRLGHSMQRGVAHDTGVVDQDVDRPNRRFHLADTGRAGFEVRDIPLEDADSGLVVKPARGLGIPCIAGRHLIPRPGESPRNRGADSPTSARYQCDACHACFSNLSAGQMGEIRIPRIDLAQTTTTRMYEADQIVLRGPVL
ncbi:hypothetical protein chiPu_0030385, partial [Chiloscyllium punctatum]|nr:hypothetical protein [Chiloscyllium punctatum]